jgi:hypothetical protein
VFSEFSPFSPFSPFSLFCPLLLRLRYVSVLSAATSFALCLSVLSAATSFALCLLSLNIKVLMMSLSSFLRTIPQ